MAQQERQQELQQERQQRDGELSPSQSNCQTLKTELPLVETRVPTQSQTHL